MEENSGEKYCFRPEGAIGGNSVRLLKNGEEVESGDTSRVLSHPAHAYTQALLDAVPDFLR